MKRNNYFFLCMLTLLLGILPANVWADRETLAAWDFSSNVKYEGETSNNVTFYTPSEAAKSNMEFAFSANKPYFYPTSCIGAMTDYALSIWSSDTNKKWYISDFNSGALRMYTASPQVITNYMDASQHYNYAEVTFPATGYKNIQFSFKMSGNNGNVIPGMVVVSTDGGNTWMNVSEYKTGGSWSSFEETTVNLSVSNVANVMVRALVGYHKGATSDMYMNNFKVTGEALGDETYFNGSVSVDDATHGYATISPAGGVYESGTQLTVQATPFLGYKFKEWQKDGAAVSEMNPYSFTIDANTALTAVFDHADMYALTTTVSPVGTGSVSCSPSAELYEDGTQVELTAEPNVGYTFDAWKDTEGNILSTDNPYTITITDATDIVASFREADIPEGTIVQLANWTFNTGYDKADNVYTPNGTEWAEISSKAFSNEVPQFLPNEYFGTQADYVATGMVSNGTWQICSGWQNEVFRIVNSTANNITDYTDASSHDVYYEIQFPTKGFRNITVDYACAYGQNEVGSLEAVISTDGGQTWSDAGSYETMGNWWLYKDNTVTLSANDKERVILRLITGNGFASNWNMNYITVKGEKMAGPINENNFTLTWPLGNGNDDATSAEVKTEGLFSVAEFDHGSLIVTTVRSAGTSRQTLYNPSENTGAPTESDNLTFTMIPKKGLTFTPKKFSFNASRWGTGGGKFDVVAIANGEETVLEKGLTPDHGNAGNFSACSYDLSNITVGEDGLVMKIKVYSLALNKEYGFGSVVVTGNISGTPEAVPSYSMNLSMNMDGAGKLSSNPAGNEFDEGTKITVSATENFGYHFQGWADENGEMVSTKNPYSFEIDKNTTLVATYTKTNIYALNIKLEGGANDNLVQYEPVGNVVDGVHWYEEGTDVKLTVSNNKILTFIGWENNTTNMERTIKMDGEKTLTANFSAVDYIVGWDLYYDQPGSNRAADYKSDTENAGLLSLTNASGSTSGWLTRGISNGFENGRPGARVWKYRSEGWYFQISFSSKGYSNIKVSNGLSVSYNTYETTNIEYSLDGTNFTKFGEFHLNTGWTDGEFDLPEECNDQQRVYVRWWGDRDSELIGNSTDYDGLCIGNIFVTADAEGLADEVATLVSSNPEQNGTGVSANGSVILTFDKKIKAGEGKAYLNGEEIAPIISGKSAVFNYSGLKYATDYTFTMPEGVLVSRSGNKVAAATIHFTTMERQQPEMRLYDAVVAQDGTGDFETVQAAIDAAPAGRGTPWLIFVKNGNYKEHVSIPASKPYLHIIGQDRDKAVILDDKLSGGDNNQGIDGGCTVLVKANNTFFENITLENEWGHVKQAGPQALALNTGGDRIVLNNVALLSYQDTWITTSTSNNRHYIKNSLIEGAVDFIYNSGNVYLDHDTIEINRPSGGYIVAPSHAADVKWGYVFMNNILRAHPGVNVTDVWLGRPWHNSPKTVFINLQTFINIPAAGWYETMGGLPVLWADYNTVDADGNPVDLSQRRDTYYRTENGERIYGKAKNYLTPEEAAQYTIKNVMGGDDNWQPELLCEACDAPVVSIVGNQLTWQPVPYAICYVIVKDGQVVGFTTDCEYEYEDGANYTIQAANEQGGLSEKAIPTVADAINTFNAVETNADAIYTTDGRKVNNMQHGINIVKQANGRVVKVIK